MQPPLKLGVVGGGRAFERLYLPILQSARSWQLISLADPDEGRRALAGAAGATTFDTVEAMLAGPTLDAVAVLSPAGLHVAHAEAALAAGLPVLIEKPVSMELAPIRRWHESGWLANVTAAFPRRFWPAYQAVRRQAAGAHQVTLGIRTDPAGWGPVTAHNLHPLADLGPHLIDLARWATGVEPASVDVAANARGARLRFASAGREVTLVVVHGAPYAEMARVDGRVRRVGPPGFTESALRRLRSQGQPETAAMATMLRRWAKRVRGEETWDLPGPADVWASVAILEAALAALPAGRVTGLPVAPFPGND